MERKRKRRKGKGTVVSPEGLIRKTVWETYSTICSAYADRPCLGYLVMSEFQPEWKWITYAEFYRRVTRFAHGLRLLQNPTQPESSPPMLAIWGNNRVEWLVADWSCTLLSWTSLPLHPSLPLDSFKHILETTHPTFLLCDPSLLSGMLSQDSQVLHSTSLLHLIFFSSPSFTPPLPFTLFSQLEDSPSTSSPFIPPIPSDHLIMTINFTSGSTGCPKGSVITHSMMLQDFSLAAQELVELSKEEEDVLTPPVQMAIYNLAYISPRDDFQNGILLGGRLGLFSRDMQFVFEDLSSLQPTTIRGVPALWIQLFNEYQQSKGNEEQKLKIFRNLFGDQLREVAAGGAPLPPPVTSWMEKCFGDAYVGEGYGTSETGLIAQNHEILPDVEVKLRDVPELAYFSTDKPWGRGEVCVKTEAMIREYYGEEKERMQSHFTEDGYFRTGDVGEMRKGKNGRELYIIDRLKNIVKLAQGEFICPVRLETIYQSALPCVRHVFVYSESEWRGVVAVVVPHTKIEAGDGESWKKKTLERMRAIGEESKLRAHERVRDIYVEMEGGVWTMQTGLLTASMKVRRPKVREYYAKRLGELYRQSVRKEEDEKRESLGRAFADQLGGYALEQMEWGGQGLDSLGAVRLSEKLRRELQIHIPPATLLSSSEANLTRLLEEADKTSNSTRWTELCERAEEKQIQRLVHDLSTEFEPMTEFQSSPPQKNLHIQDASTERFLITGTTGFLGAYILYQLLHTVSSSHCICLVRGESTAHAKLRLQRHLQEYNLWDESFRLRITVIRGDLGQQRLGVSEEDWPAVLSSILPITRVYHVAAQVDWLRSYESLFDSNVRGTLRMLQLAQWAQQHSSGKVASIPFYHVSTGGVVFCEEARMDASSERFGEDPVKTARKMKSEGISGYLMSKIVAEHWLFKMSVRAGAKGRVSVRVYRPGDVSGDSVTGASNRGDFLSRYLLTVVHAHRYCKSRSKVEMLPVNIVAQVVVEDSLKDACNHSASPQVRELTHPKAFTLNYNQMGEIIRDALQGTECVGLQQQDFVDWVSKHPDAPVFPLLNSIDWSDDEEEEPTPSDTSAKDYLLRCVWWLTERK